MVYMFLAEGFEETEALCPLDLLRRADVPTTTVGIGGDLIKGAHGISVKTDVDDKSLDLKEKDIAMIVLPGGMPGTVNLDQSAVVHNAIDVAFKQGACVAAICAAPMILGKRGDLTGKKAVCYPGFEKYLTGAKIQSDDVTVTTDGNIITARGMGVALEFGLCLVQKLRGPEKADELRASTIAP